MVLRLPLKILIESHRGFNKRRRRKRKKLVMGIKKKKKMKIESEEKETDNSKKNSEILASCSFSSLFLLFSLADMYLLMLLLALAKLWLI